MTDAQGPSSKQPNGGALFRRLRSWFSTIHQIRSVSESAADSARILQSHLAKADQMAARMDQMAATADQMAARMDQRMDQMAATANQMGVLFEELKQHVWESFRQIGEANQRLDRLSEGLSNELSQTRAQVQGLKREIMFQQRRLSRLGERLAAGDGALPELGAHLVDERVDSLYVAFEDMFRGTREDIKSRLLPYIEQIELADAGRPGKPILDIGCGRGEWLELLRDHHFEAYGVDLNSMMIERCKSMGLNASRGDVIEHLRELPDESRSAITAFHVIEHIPFDVFVYFLDEALRVLTPGGILILETPNPETIRVGATTFYYDPTHRNPLPPIPTQFIVSHRGFVEAEILRLHPVTEERLRENGENVDLLNRVLFGPQDYAIIARRDVEPRENLSDMARKADAPASLEVMPLE